MTIQERLCREAGLVGDSDFLASMLRQAADNIDTLTEENERLREVLEEIAIIIQQPISEDSARSAYWLARTALSQHTQYPNSGRSGG